MFVEVRLNGSSERTLINLDHVLRADYERISNTQANVTLRFINGETMSLEEDEGRNVLDALQGRARRAPLGVR